jgi:hypothetical protein
MHGSPGILEADDGDGGRVGPSSSWFYKIKKPERSDGM